MADQTMTQAEKEVLMEAYISKIRNSNPRNIKIILNGLEELLNRIYGNEAIVLRNQLGVSRVDVAKMLPQGQWGGHDGMYQAISKFEKGEVKDPLKGKNVREYLLWLKSQGYNPYHI